MYGQLDQSEKQRKKLILVSAVMGLIILVLAVVLVNAIINKNKKEVASETSDTEVALEEGNDAKENSEVSRAESSEDSNLEPVSNETDGNASVASSSDSESSAGDSSSDSQTSQSAQSQLPTTGPSEVLSLALLLGSAAMFLVSTAYRKELA